MTLVKNINGIYTGTTSDLNSFRGRLYEIAINNQTKQFRLMDGKTAGGFAMGVSAVVDSLSEIGDVSLSGLTPGQSLVWDGSNWTNSTITATIEDGSITAAKLASDSVITAKILDGAVTNAKLAGSIALSKLSTAGGTNGQVIRLNGGVATYTTLSLSDLSGVALIGTPTAGQMLIYNTTGSTGWKNYTLSGDVTVNSTGVTSITNGAVTLSKLATTGASTGSLIKYDGTQWAIGSDTNTTSLSGLTTDVLVASPSVAQVLIYDDADSKWKNKSLSGEVTITKAGVASLAPSNLSIGLGKLSQDSANSGQVIAWNGSAWAPTTISTSSDRITSGAYSLVVQTQGYVTIPTSTYGTAQMFSQSGVDLYIGTLTSNNYWQFKDSGVLKLPPNGDIVDSNNVSVLSTGGSDLATLGWDMILDTDPTGGGFPGIGTGDRGFILNGASDNAKVALYYDDSTDKVYLKGNTASNGADIYVEAGHSTASNGGKVRLYGGDALASGDPDNLNYGHGGYVRLRGGYADTTSIGGYIELQAGGSTLGAGGYVNIDGGYAGSQSLNNGGSIALNGGPAYGGGNGGVISLTAGSASEGSNPAGNGGNVLISAGSTNGSVSQTGGSILLNSGYSSSGNGGDINLNTNIGTGVGNSAGNIHLTPGTANSGASEGKIILNGKVELTQGFFSDTNVYQSDDALVHGTIVYLYVIYGDLSKSKSERFHIYKTSDSGSTRQIVPLTIIDILEDGAKIARLANSSLYEYTASSDTAWANPGNKAVAYFIMDEEGGTYDYIFKGNSNEDNGQSFYAACSILSTPTVENPIFYTNIFPLGFLNDREYLLTPNVTNVDFLAPPGLQGATSTFNQVSLLASVDANTGEFFLENLKASIPSIPGEKGVVGANAQGVISLVDNFKIHIPNVNHRDILRYDALTAKWQASGFIDPVFQGTYTPIADGRTYYHLDIVDPLVFLPNNGVDGDIFYVQLGPNQNRLTFKVPSPTQRLTAFYQGFLVTHPTNMYSGYELGQEGYWSPSTFYNGNQQTISENYIGTDTVVISNFGGLVEFRCYPVNSQSLQEGEVEYTWHVSVLSGLKPAMYTPSLYYDIIAEDEITVVGKGVSLYRSEMVSDKVYYYIGNDTYFVEIDLPALCPAMMGVEINIKQTGLMDMHIIPSTGNLIEGEFEFIMSEKGAMATLINDGTNWYLA